MTILIAGGGAYFAYMAAFHREVLDTVPGDDRSAAASEVTTAPTRAAELTGRVVRQDDAGYPVARTSWNLLFAHRPVAVVFASETHDVVDALTWARQNGFPVRVRSGGHCLEGWSTVDDGVVIDHRRREHQHGSAVGVARCGQRQLRDRHVADVSGSSAAAGHLRRGRLAKYDPDDVFNLEQSIAPSP